MGKLIVISDLHIDRWADTGKYDAFRDFLHYVRSNASTLVINGDIVDFPPIEGEEVSDKVKSVLGELAALPLSGVELIYLPGNHDIALRGLPMSLLRFQLAYPRKVIDVARTRIYLEHGHYYDPLFNGGYEMLDALNKFTGYDIGKIAVDTWKAVTRFLQREDPESAPGGDVGREDAPEWVLERWEEAAERVKAEYDCQYVLFGHTHNPKPPGEDPVYYINTGDWASHMTVTEFDETGQPDQYDWSVSPRVSRV